MRLTLGILFIAAILLGGSLAFAGDSHWEFCGWYGGGCYPNVEFDPNVKNRVYLTSDVAGIWRSDDLGENWQFINNGLGYMNVAVLSAARNYPGVLYAGTKGGLFVSQDSGDTWNSCGDYSGGIKFDRPGSYRSIAVSAYSTGKVCAGTNSGDVLYSENYGKTWKALGGKAKPFNKEELITAVIFDKQDKNLWVGSKDGIARFNFQDKRWTKNEKTPVNVFDLSISSDNPALIYAAAGNALWRSADEGHTWEIVEQLSASSKVLRVAISEKILGIAWERDWKGGVLVSSDGGKNWEPVDEAISPNKTADPTRAWANGGGRPTALKIDPFNNNVLSRTDWWGVFRSDDAGKSWQEKITGAPNTVGSDIVFDEKGCLYVATMDNGLLKSEDNGKSYLPVYPQRGYKDDINGHTWRVSSLGGERMIATASPWGRNINQVILSNDGGKTFEVTRQGLPENRPKVNTMWGQGYPRALAVDPNNKDTVYLGIDGDDGGGIFRSLDAGKTWTRLESQPDSTRIYNALSVDPTDSKRIIWGACGKWGGVYLSENAGKKWRCTLAEMDWVFDSAISKDGIMYAAGDKSGPCLYVSNNHGKSWKLLKKFPGNGTAEAIAIDPANPKKIAVSLVQWSGTNDGRIYLSLDGGSNWQDISGDLPPGAGAAAMTFSPDGTYLYITRYAGGVYRFKL